MRGPILLLAFIFTGCGEVTPPVLTGTLIAVVRTYGGDRDTNYQIVVGTQVKQVFGDGSVAFTVDAGPHVVTINQVDDNCSVEGLPAATVEVPKGKSAEAVFTVNCDATGISVLTETEGTDQPNDYQVKVNASLFPIAPNGKLTVSRLAPGSHTAEITLPGDNCSLDTPAIQRVNVENRRLTSVFFLVDCRAPARLPKIAYHSLSASPLQFPNEIFIADPDGSGAKRIASGQNPSWSPDGKRIAFAATHCDYYYGCSSRLGIIDPETTHSVSHSIGGHRIETPAWSPDGQLIAYTELVNEALYVFPPGGGMPIHVSIPGATRVREPSWSPDAKKIAVACLVSFGNYDICVINRDGSGLTRLVQRASVDTKPAWSPDGNTIAFAVAPSNEAIGEIALVPASGGDVTTVTQGTDPSWSKDGARLMFSRSDGLYAINLNGTGLTRLTTGNHRAPASRP
jgi:hypothetical protein